MKEMTWTVEVSDDDAQALSQFDDERIADELVSTLEELASADSKRDDLHDRMNISTGDSEELSGAALEEEMRRYLRGERKNDPRLD